MLSLVFEESCSRAQRMAFIKNKDAYRAALPPDSPQYPTSPVMFLVVQTLWYVDAVAGEEPPKVAATLGDILTA